MTVKRCLVLLTLAALGGAAALAMAPRGGTAPEGPASSPIQPIAPQPSAVNSYPFYMPMQGLKRPAVKLYVKCDASRRAGKEVYAGASAQAIGGRAEGGYEITFEATDSAGNACVYPFYPWLPQVVGSLHNTQDILRSSVPGQQVTFRTGDQWATINLRLFDFGQQRVHFEMSDIALDFPGAVQPKGGLHLETFGGQAPGLFTAVIRRSKVFGGKNGLFVPGGQTMLYIEDSEFLGNVGSNVDQEHTSYINGILVSHLRNSVWRGQRGWQDVASGHQLKDKAYLRVYENVTVTNTPNGAAPSAMPLVDISAMGFTWANNLTLGGWPRRRPRARRWSICAVKFSTVRRACILGTRWSMALGACPRSRWPRWTRSISRCFSTPRWRAFAASLMFLRCDRKAPG